MDLALKAFYIVTAAYAVGAIAMICLAVKFNLPLLGSPPPKTSQPPVWKD